MKKKNNKITEKDWGDIRLKNHIKNRGFTLIGPKAREGDDVSRRERTHNAADLKGHIRIKDSGGDTMSRSAFTLIELIVVMAVIGILVLLAAPKFLGYTEHAKYTRDIHLAKTLENSLEDFLSKGGKLEDYLQTINKDVIQDSANKKMVLNPNGFVDVVDDGIYYEMTYEFIKHQLNVSVAQTEKIKSPFIEAFAAEYPIGAYADITGKAFVDRAKGLEGYIDEYEDINAPENCPTPESLQYDFDHTSGTILKYNGTESHITIPPYLMVNDKCYRVRVVGPGAFMGKEISDVNIPSTVEIIDDNAFNDNDLVKINIPDSVKVIGENAFKDNLLGNELTPTPEIIPDDYSGVLLPESVIVIESGAFENNNLEKIIIPDNVLEIGDNAFKDNNVSEVFIPGDIIIGETIFSGNKSASIIISNGVKIIPSNMFNGSGIVTVVFPEGLERIEDYAFAYNQIIAVNLPSSLVYIGNYAFAYNRVGLDISIKNITFKSNEYIEKLDDNGNISENGNKLESIDAMVLMDNIFTVNDSIGGIIPQPEWPPISPISEVTPEGYFTFVDTTGSITKFHPTGISGTLPLISDVVIPSSIRGVSVSSLAADSFSNTGLVSAFIPSSVITINARAFKNNDIATLTISDGVQTILQDAFSYNNITAAVFPDSIVKLESDLFVNNPLKYLKIFDDTKGYPTNGNTPFAYKFFTEVQVMKGTGVTSLEYVFSNSGYRGTSAIQKVTIGEGVKNIPMNTFYHVEINEVILPETLTDIGKKSFFLTKLPKIIIPESVTIIQQEAFGSNELTEIILPSNLNTLGLGAFENNLLTSIIIPTTITSLADDVFMNNQLTSVDIPSNIQSIGYRAFKDNFNLSSVTIANGVTRIESFAFENAPIENLIIPDSVISMDSEVFKGNHSFIDVSVPSDLKYQYKYVNYDSIFAFTTIKNLNIYKGDGIDNFKNAFSDRSQDHTMAIETINIQEGVAIIPEYAFDSVIIGTVNFPQSLTTISKNAFNKSSIAEIALPNSITSIGNMAFYGNKFTTVTIPQNLVSIGVDVFTKNGLNSDNISNVVGTAAEIKGKTFNLIDNVWMMQ